jgi:hypothetical protein
MPVVHSLLQPSYYDVTTAIIDGTALAALAVQLCQRPLRKRKDAAHMSIYAALLTVH